MHQLEKKHFLQTLSSFNQESNYRVSLLAEEKKTFPEEFTKQKLAFWVELDVQLQADIWLWTPSPSKML